MFSVIIPVYNKAAYIGRAIESVLAQEFEEWELIVVDDGSTDGSRQIVESFSHPNVLLYRQPNSGVSVARNTGIAKAKFPYIAFLDADDYWHPSYLMTIWKGTICYPNAGIWGTSYAYGDFQFSASTGLFEILDDYFSGAIRNTRFFTSAVVVAKEFFSKNEGFKPYLKRGEDLDVWFRVIGFYGAGAYCQDRLVWYEQSDGQSATKSTFGVANTLVGHIAKPEYFNRVIFHSEKIASQFRSFSFQFTLFNVYPYFQDPENHASIRSILDEIGLRYSLISLFYKLPYRWIVWFISGRQRRLLFRNYMKFCFRFFYSRP